MKNVSLDNTSTLAIIAPLSYVSLVVIFLFTSFIAQANDATVINNSENKEAKSEPLFTISGQYTSWFVSWDQRSTAAERFGHLALDIDYEIDDAIARMGEVTVAAYGFEFDFNLVDIPDSTNGVDKGLSALSYGINYVNFFGGSEISYRYSETEFEGQMMGEKYNGETGETTFTSTFSHHDILLMTKWGIGISYRTFNYFVPQDIYTVAEFAVNPDVTNSAPMAPTLVSSATADIDYEADFIAAVFRNEDLLNNAGQGLNLGYQFKYGVGNVTANSDAIDEVQQILADAGFVQERLIDEGDGEFIEFDVYAAYPIVNSNAFTTSIKIGFRYEKTSVNFGYIDTIRDIPEGRASYPTYSVVADFETEMSGGYAAIEFRW